MRMVLETLFNKVNELNQSLKVLGCEKQYGIRFTGKRSFDNFDCYAETYIDINKFVEAMSQESYYTNIENSIVEVMETGRNIDDLEYEVHFEGRTNGTNEKVEEDVYVYLSEL